MEALVHDAALRERTVGEIAARLPGATAVFRRHKLDFCCGGEKRLAEAALARGVDVAGIEQELAALDTGRGEPDGLQETGALIDHILARYHETHRRELPELARLARRVEAVHAEHAEAPHGLADLLATMEIELTDHMAKEENVLFPMMRRMPGGRFDPPIARMRDEHDDHGRTLARLRALAHDFVLPAGACRSWQALYAGAAKLADDLMDHIHLENNVLFPRFSGDAA